MTKVLYIGPTAAPLVWLHKTQTKSEVHSMSKQQISDCYYLKNEIMQIYGIKYRSASQILTECEVCSFLCERSKVQSSYISSRAPCLKINMFLFNNRLSCGWNASECFPNVWVYIITVKVSVYGWRMWALGN